MGNMTDYDVPNRCTLDPEQENSRLGNFVVNISNEKHVCPVWFTYEELRIILMLLTKSIIGLVWAPHF